MFLIADCIRCSDSGRFLAKVSFSNAPQNVTLPRIIAYKSTASLHFQIQGTDTSYACFACKTTARCVQFHHQGTNVSHRCLFTQVLSAMCRANISYDLRCVSISFNHIAQHVTVARIVARESIRDSCIFKLKAQITPIDACDSKSTARCVLFTVNVLIHFTGACLCRSSALPLQKARAKGQEAAGPLSPHRSHPILPPSCYLGKQACRLACLATLPDKRWVFFNKCC